MYLETLVFEEGKEDNTFFYKDPLIHLIMKLRHLVLLAAVISILILKKNHIISFM